MMKIKFLAFFLLITFAVSAQNTAHVKSVKKAHKLNLSDFKNSKKVRWENYTQLIKNDTVFRFSKEDGKIRKEFFKRNENAKKIEMYDDQTFSPLSESSMFFNFPTGSYRKYDSKGNIIQEINYDKDYRVSLMDIISLAKAKFNIDITQKISGVGVTRGFDEHFKKNVYTLSLPVNEQSYRFVIIDATSKKILSDQRGNYIE
ncbi:hypothetical protein [Flavobacterium rivuli]|nr:hypothetical protein [Flavobacterium rivuli]